MKYTLTQLEQKAQKAMMNPHFIFNVINTIQHYINEDDKELANQYLNDFAKLIRLCNNFAQKSKVSIKEELEYLSLYLSFEKIRYHELLAYEIVVDPTLDINSTFISVMLIQPILENAIWHGILPANKKGHVKLSIEKHSENLIKITITDNGIGIDVSYLNKNLLELNTEMMGAGLAMQRLKLLAVETGFPLFFYYQHLTPKDKQKGTQASFIIPLIN